MTTKKYPSWVCQDCGVKANTLTCIKKYGSKPKKLQFSVSTYHRGTCEVCGKEKMVTEPRDFFYPNFGLLEGKREKEKQKKLENTPTHMLTCRHAIGRSGNVYYMECRLLKKTKSGRAKIVLFGERNWKDKKKKRSIRYVEFHRLTKIDG